MHCCVEVALGGGQTVQGLPMSAARLSHLCRRPCLAFRAGGCRCPAEPREDRPALSSGRSLPCRRRSSPLAGPQSVPAAAGTAAADGAAAAALGGAGAVASAGVGQEGRAAARAWERVVPGGGAAQVRAGPEPEPCQIKAAAGQAWMMRLFMWRMLKRSRAGRHSRTHLRRWGSCSALRRCRRRRLVLQTARKEKQHRDVTAGVHSSCM